MKTEEIAKACHEMNRLYCSFLGDHSQPTWDQAADWIRESAIEGVKNILDRDVTTPAASHEVWMVHKLRQGWRYGPEKDVDEKTHPGLLPHSQLPVSQRMKDAIFFAVTRGLETED